MDETEGNTHSWFIVMRINNQQVWLRSRSERKYSWLRYLFRSYSTISWLHLSYHRVKFQPANELIADSSRGPTTSTPTTSCSSGWDNWWFNILKSKPIRHITKARTNTVHGRRSEILVLFVHRWELNWTMNEMWAENLETPSCNCLFVVGKCHMENWRWDNWLVTK